MRGLTVQAAITLLIMTLLAITGTMYVVQQGAVRFIETLEQGFRLRITVFIRMDILC